MIAEISAEGLASFFAYAPLAFGLIIVVVAWASTRNEHDATAVNVGTTYACANCGRRSNREHMLPQAHEGAVSWYCSRCAGAH